MAVISTKQTHYNDTNLGELGRLLNVDLAKHVQLTKRGELSKRAARLCIQALAHRYQVDLRSLATYT